MMKKRLNQDFQDFKIFRMKQPEHFQILVCLLPECSILKIFESRKS
jgi:hypothetical protein